MPLHILLGKFLIVGICTYIHGSLRSNDIYLYIYIYSQESFTADRFGDNALLKRATRCAAQEEANYTRENISSFLLLALKKHR